MADDVLRIGHLYPDEMNLYGDRGNVLTLVRRIVWWGLAVEVEPIDRGRVVDWDRFALVFMGGGEDSHQVHIAEDFLQRGPDLLPRLERGLPMLAICGAYQLLGREYVTGDGRHLPGIGFLDVRTESGGRRQIGDVVGEIQGLALTPSTVVGFENHGGMTSLGPEARPLAQVGLGSGNNGADGTEGAVKAHVIGTYLHGSLLPKNPHLADLLIGWALRYMGRSTPIDPLDDVWEMRAHQVMVERAGRARLRSPRGR